jgi:hypothetical protein
VEPTAVRIGLMDSRRPGLVEWLPARHLTPMQRAWRALKRGFVVGGTSLVVTNLLVLFVPIPWLHFCTVPFAILAGPLMAVLTVRGRTAWHAASWCSSISPSLIRARPPADP